MEQTQTLDDDEGAPFDLYDAYACAERVKKWEQNRFKIVQTIRDLIKRHKDNSFSQQDREILISSLEKAATEMIMMNMDIEAAFKKVHAHKAETSKFKELYDETAANLKVWKRWYSDLKELYRKSTFKYRKALDITLILMYTAMSFYFLAKCASSY